MKIRRTYIKIKRENRKGKYILFPKDVLRQALKEKSIDPIENYLEDWELAHDPKFLARLRKGQKDAKAGRLIPWEQIKTELKYKSK